MRSLILLALLSLTVLSQAKFLGNLDQLEGELFSQFQDQYNIQYSSQEETAYRFNVFQSNLLIIAELVKQEPGAVFGITKFSDQTPEEFAANHLNYNAGTQSPLAQPEFEFSAESVTGDVPASWDWRTEGAVTSVKNQGQCGSCWSFSATANIEGQYFLKHNSSISFAEQQFVDCDTIDAGCNGGLMTNAFTYLKGTDGLETYADYPYTAVQGTCVYKSSKAVAKVSGYFNVSTNETLIAAALYATGPLAIAADATTWQFYIGGILGSLTKGYLCGTTLDHGVTLVGYGASGSTEFWIVKNSWGADWGESGYLRVIRGYDACGMNLDVSSSIVE